MAIYNLTDTAYAGLQVAQAGMLVTSQNVTGSSVDGFTRRNANTVMDSLAPNNLQLNGTSFAVDGFTRQYSALLGSQMLTQQAKSSYSDTFVQYTSPLNSLVSDANTGMTSSLSTFFNAMGTYAADPTSKASAGAITAAANDVANRMQGMSAIITSLTSNAKSGLTDTVNQANTLLPELAKINLQITGATSPGNSSPSADLLDERDRILTSLQKLVGGQSLINSDGTATQLVNGLPLVERGIANKLTISNDQTAINVEYNSKDAVGNPNLQSLVTISGGQAGALENIINTFVPSINQRLNALAMGLVKVVNQAGQSTPGQPTQLPIFGFKVGSNIYSSLSGGDLTSSIPNITSLSDLQNLYSGLANSIGSDSTLALGALPGTVNSQVASITAQPNAAKGIYTFSQGASPNDNQVTLSVTLNGKTVSQTATVADSVLGASQTLNFDKLGIAVNLANPIAYSVPTSSGLRSGSAPVGISSTGQLQSNTTLNTNTNIGVIGLTSPAAAGTYAISANAGSLTMTGTVNGTPATQTINLTSGSQTVNFSTFGISIPVTDTLSASSTTIAANIASKNNIILASNTNVGTIALAGSAVSGTYNLTQGKAPTGNPNQLIMSGTVNGSSVSQTLTLSAGNQTLNFDKFGITIPVSNLSTDTAATIASNLASAGSISVSAGNFSVPVTSGINYNPATVLTVNTKVSNTNPSGVVLTTSASPGTYSFTADANGNLTISGTYNGSPLSQTIQVPNVAIAGTTNINFSQFGISINLASTAADTGAAIATAIATAPNNSITISPSSDSAVSIAHALAGNGGTALNIDVSGAPNTLQDYGLTAANFISVAPSDPNAYMNGTSSIISSTAANAVSQMSGVFAETVANLTSDVGNHVATALNTQKSDTAVLNNLTSQFNSISGVNLDEEAANLLKYQQLYAASSKVLQTGNQMFSALLAIMN